MHAARLPRDADTTVPLQQSKLMKAKYKETGLTVDLIVQPGRRHRSWPGIMDHYPAVWAWFDKFLRAENKVAAADKTSRTFGPRSVNMQFPWSRNP